MKKQIYILLLGAAAMTVVCLTTEASPGTGTSTREVKNSHMITAAQLAIELPVMHLEYGAALASENVRFNHATYWTMLPKKSTAGRKASYYYLMGAVSRHAIPYGMRS